MLFYCFNHTLRAELPESLTEAIISVIPKEGKEGKYCGLFGPVSLLSTQDDLDNNNKTTLNLLYMPLIM